MAGTIYTEIRKYASVLELASFLPRNHVFLERLLFIRRSEVGGQVINLCRSMA